MSRVSSVLDPNTLHKNSVNFIQSFPLSNYCLYVVLNRQGWQLRKLVALYFICHPLDRILPCGIGGSLFMVYIMTKKNSFVSNPNNNKFYLRKIAVSKSSFDLGRKHNYAERCQSFFLAVARRLPFLPGPGPDTPFQRKCVLGSGSDRKCRERTTVTKKHWPLLLLGFLMLCAFPFC